MSAKRKAAPNRAARRKAAKRSGARMKNARTVLVDRIAVPRDVLLAMEDPTSVIMGMISEWLEDAELNLDADLFEETSIRFGRHPSPAFVGEVVIELQTVAKKSTTMPAIEGPAPVDDEGNSIFFEKVAEVSALVDEANDEPVVGRCDYVSAKSGLVCTVVDIVDEAGALPKHRHAYPKAAEPS